MTKNYLLRDGNVGNANREPSLVTKFSPVIEYNSASPLNGSIPAVEASNGADSGRTAGLAFPSKNASHGGTAPAFRFLAGDTSAETLADLRSSLVRWIMSDGSLGLHRVLGLGTPRSARLRLRDALLRQAAQPLDGSTWDRARQLSDAASVFESRRWPRWRYTGVPDSANRLDALLYEARMMGEVTLTARQYFNVLSDSGMQPSLHCR